MTDKVIKKLYLTGPNTGKTVVVGHNLAKAINGVIEVDASSDNLIKVLKRYYAVSEVDPTLSQDKQYEDVSEERESTISNDEDPFEELLGSANVEE